MLQVEQLRIEFNIGSWWHRQSLRAVDGISFKLAAGQSLGIVGESGCGKSSLARGLLRLLPLQSGSIQFKNWHWSQLSPAELRMKRRYMQMIFQNPLAALDPRMPVLDSVMEPLSVFFPTMRWAERQKKAEQLLDRVGIAQKQRQRYPHQFSGGQCQRIAIARALVVEPDILICDEAVSALDVSVQAQILQLLKQLQAELDLSLIFISHDLSVVKLMSQQILVMYLGRAMEMAATQTLFKAPRHPYTQALLQAIPQPDPQAPPLAILPGEIPSPLQPPSGCVFHTRCPQAQAECRQISPDFQNGVACLLYKDAAAPPAANA